MKTIKKEDVENLNYKDITNLILAGAPKKGMNTLDLFTKIVDILELPKKTIDDKIADYYTTLTTDKRFACLNGNWVLKSNYKSDKVIIRVEDEEEEVEEEETDEIEEDEDDSTNFDVENKDDEYESDDDDGLQDLVVRDEEDLDEQ